MIFCDIFHSVEFYVIASVAAAAIVAFLGRGSHKGPARQYLLAGVTITGEAGCEPSVELVCDEDGNVILHRRGITGVGESGAVSLAVEVVGFDVRIKERVVEGAHGGEPVTTASFILDFMGREHYFVSYESPLTSSASSMFASFNLHNRAGNRIVKKLQ